MLRSAVTGTPAGEGGSGGDVAAAAAAAELLRELVEGEAPGVPDRVAAAGLDCVAWKKGGNE
jgi:hypothetical protein